MTAQLAPTGCRTGLYNQSNSAQPPNWSKRFAELSWIAAVLKTTQHIQAKSTRITRANSTTCGVTQILNLKGLLLMNESNLHCVFDTTLVLPLH